MSDDLIQIKEVVTRGIAELRQDNEAAKEREAKREKEVDELRKDLHEVILAVKENTVSQTYLADEVKELKSDIHDREFGTNARVDKLEILASNNKLRWGMVGTLTMLLLTSLGGIYAVVTKPLSESTEQLKQAQISNAEMAGKLDAQTSALIGITNLLDEEYSRREAAGMYETTN